MRKQDSRAGQVHVFIQTSPFHRNDAQYGQAITLPLRRPTTDSALITTLAVRGLHAIYRPGFRFAKAGVMLLDLVDAGVEQGELDLDEPGPDRSRLMGTVDQLNDRFGRGSVKLASAGLSGEARSWSMRQRLRTPDYTTCWADLPRARA